MKIAVIGTGYVGLTHGTCLAELGNEVICVDIDLEKIEKLKKGIIPIFEPKLSSLVEGNYCDGRLKFTSNIDEAVDFADVIFIAVGTPAGKDGHADMQYIKSVAESIGKCISKYTIIVTKSTVPVGTGDMVEVIIKDEIKRRDLDVHFDIASNPEFLKEGTAIDDFFFGDRIIIGCDNPDNKALQVLRELYSPLKETKILNTDLHTAEIIKYGANSLLAVEISFINALSQLCEKVGADILKVSEGLKLDSRIGKKAFLNAGPGFGGSCFPKDVMEFAQTFRDYGLENGILESTLTINESQKNSIFAKILSFLPDVSQKKIAILGLSFKPDTDDIRYSPAINVVEQLIRAGAQVSAYDPEAIENFKRFYPGLHYASGIYDAVEGADCIAVITDWNEFKQPDWEKISARVRQKYIIDLRNIYDEKRLSNLGFKYMGIGRGFKS